ncbi:MAG: Maf family protein [Bacillota bacterium]|jgi:septum formation protein|nr:Maf family protein [Bacillota bacterium]
MDIILASASPRRAKLLRQAGIPFRVIYPSVSEKFEESEDPEKIVLKLAYDKAAIVAGKIEHGYIIAADTLVVFENNILGKPKDREDALRMLQRINGKMHKVITGLVLFDAASKNWLEGVAVTKVWFKKLSDDAIDAYLDTGEPLDKAGAYGIQEKAALFVEKIEGCYTNVVGLPLGLLYNMMNQMNVSLWLNRKDGDHAK